MSNEEANKILKELYEVRPEKLNDKAKRLFEAIMTIADERDEALSELKKSIPIKTYNQTKKTLKGIISRKESDLYEANNRINDLLDIVKQKDKEIDLMANEILEQDTLNQEDIAHYDNKHEVIKYFEERCK